VRSADLCVPLPAVVSQDGLARAQSFMSDYSGLLRVDGPGTEFQLVRRSRDDWRLAFRQRHDGIPMFASGRVVHLAGGDACDLCRGFFSTNNADNDNDGLGDPCDPGDDNDGVLPEEIASDPERMSRFESEARVLAALDHPNIAPSTAWRSPGRAGPW